MSMTNLIGRLFPKRRPSSRRALKRPPDRARPHLQIEQLEDRLTPSGLVGSFINIPLFNTGVDGAGSPLSVGSQDPHYSIVTNPNGSGPTAFVVTQHTISGTISPTAAGTGATGIYDYQVTFTMPATGDPSTARITGTTSADDQVNDIMINGISTGSTTGAFAITSGFQAGTNTLDFIVDNTIPTGTSFDVEMTGTVGVDITPVEGQDTSTLVSNPPGYVTLGTFNSGGNSLGNFNATINWGDGATQVGASIVDNQDGTFSVVGNHTYAEESGADHSGSEPYLIAVSVTRGGRPNPIYTVTDTTFVTDPAVVGTAAILPTLTEPNLSTGLVRVATFTDPGVPTGQGTESTGDYSATVDWGDNTAADNNTTIHYLGSNQYEVLAQHTYAEEKDTFPGPNYQVTVTIHHENATDTVVNDTQPISDPNVTVNANSGVPQPLASIFEQASTPAGAVIGTFTDPGNPTGTIDSTQTWTPPEYRATIDWGDGSTPNVLDSDASPSSFVSLGNGTFEVLAPAHQYKEEGLYNITLTVKHENLLLVPGTPGNTQITDTITVLDVPVTVNFNSGGTPTSGTLPTIREKTGSTADQAIVGEFSDTGNPAGTFDAAPNAQTAANPEYTVVIGWGDGTTTTVDSFHNPTAIDAVTSEVFAVKAPTHTYADEGTYHITLTVFHDGLPPTAAVQTATIQVVEEALDPGVADGPNGTADERFINEVYRDLLNREADPSGLNHWITILNTLQTPAGGNLDVNQARAQVTLMIEEDPGNEYRKVQVQNLYTLLLHRMADQGGLNTYVTDLDNGMTVEQVASLIVTSPEYTNRTRADGSTAVTDTGFINALYQDFLGRAPDAGGLAGYLNDLAPAPGGKGMSRAQVALLILSSNEYHTDLVAQDYAFLLDRSSAGDGGAQGWINLLNAGGPNGRDENVIAGITGQPQQEYYGKTVPTL